MKFNTNKFKVALDIYKIQMLWTSWALLLVTVITILFSFTQKTLNLKLFIQLSFIYMVVIGIISCLSLLPHFVGNGITRKNYFLGTTIAGAGVTFSIIAIFEIIAMGFSLISSFTSYTFTVEYLAFFDSSQNYYITLFISALNVFSYYLAGWIVGLGFYRFTGWKAYSFIMVSTFTLYLTNLIWSIPIPYTISILATLSILVVGLCFVRLMSKSVPIKFNGQL